VRTLRKHRNQASDRSLASMTDVFIDLSPIAMNPSKI